MWSMAPEWMNEWVNDAISWCVCMVVYACIIAMWGGWMYVFYQKRQSLQFFFILLRSKWINEHVYFAWCDVICLNTNFITLIFLLLSNFGAPLFFKHVCNMFFYINFFNVAKFYAISVVVVIVSIQLFHLLHAYTYALLERAYGRFWTRWCRNICRQNIYLYATPYCCRYCCWFYCVMFLFSLYLFIHAWYFAQFWTHLSSRLR